MSDRKQTFSLDAWKRLTPLEWSSPVVIEDAVHTLVPLSKTACDESLLSEILTGATAATRPRNLGLQALKAAHLVGAKQGKDSGLSLCWCALSVALSGHLGDIGPKSLATTVLVRALIRITASPSFAATRRELSSEDEELVALAGSYLRRDGNAASTLFTSVGVVKMLEGGSQELAATPENSKNEKIGKPVAVPAKIIAKAQIRADKTSDLGKFFENWKFLESPLPLRGDPARVELVEYVLYEEFPWAEDAIRRILAGVRLRARVGKGFWIRPTILVGPPGVGKSSLVRRLAELSEIGFGCVNAAGSVDNRSLQGTAQGWHGRTPCFPAHVFQATSSANPIILVDDLDKASSERRNGSIFDSLLTMTEPATNLIFPDECLNIPIDLSSISWIATANSVERLRGPLLTRFRVIEISPPRAEHFDAVLKGALHSAAAELCVSRSDLPELDARVIDRIRAAFATGDFSLRRIRSAIEVALETTAFDGLDPVLH